VKWSPQISPIALDPPTPNAATFAHAINNLGMIAGGVNIGQTIQITVNGQNGGSSGIVSAARWDEHGGISVLDGLGSQSSPSTTIGLAINDQGTVVGSVAAQPPNLFFTTRAVRWDAGSNVPTLLTAPNMDQVATTGSAAYAINSSGTAVGQYPQTKLVPT